jgi:hypothetical protein
MRFGFEAGKSRAAGALIRASVYLPYSVHHESPFVKFGALSSYLVKGSSEFI